jgi:hypothetical protein
VETTNYLVDLDKYAHRLEDVSCTLFGQIRDAIVDARQYQPRCVQLERENSVLRYHVCQLEQSLTLRPLSCYSSRGSVWTPVRSCCTSTRTSAS